MKLPNTALTHSKRENILLKNNVTGHGVNRYQSEKMRESFQIVHFLLDI